MVGVAHPTQQRGVHRHDQASDASPLASASLPSTISVTDRAVPAQRAGNGERQIAVGGKRGQAFDRERPVTVVPGGMLGGNRSRRGAAFDDADSDAQSAAGERGRVRHPARSGRFGRASP